MRKAFNYLWLFLLFSSFYVAAHAPNQSYIYLRVYEKAGIDASFELTTLDINKIFGTNFTRDAGLDELQPYYRKIQDYLLNHASFSSVNGNHEMVFKDVSMRYLGMGNYLQVNFHLKNTENVPDNLEVNYSAVFEKDDTHRAFLIIGYNWKAGIINREAIISLSFTPDQTSDTLSLTDTSVWKGFVAMVNQGIYHIWIGLDHILFLLALILPSVVRRLRDNKVSTANSSAESQVVKSGFITWDWYPVEHFKPAFLYIIKVITFFTIAHTITLSLASLEIVNLPSRFVESIIALSIGLAAYHNIRPIFKGRDWVIAFIFGLFHGFGFASVLSDLGLTSEFLTLSLLGFNIGVEIGQLFIIALIFPILFLIRKRKSYPKLLVYGSIFLIIVSLYWFTERVFDINLLVEDYLRSVARGILKALGLR